MRFILFLSLFTSAIFANDATHTFSSNETCKSCHPQIYKEYSGSMHTHSTPQKDPIHNSVWAKHPANTKKQHYGCGKCHTPAASNLDAMLTPGKKALPDPNNTTHQEGISCAYCHRIKDIKLHKKHNTNIISTQQKAYYGTRTGHIDSPYHTIITEGNEHILNGNVCIGCHSHKMNKHKLNVCSTNIKNEMNGANCVSCHMPQVSGTLSNLHATKTHAFHGFAGSHFHTDMLQQYVDINLHKQKNGFAIEVQNHTSHALLLHPLRMALLKVTIIRGSQTIPLKEKVFVRVIGKDGKPAMPWKATTTLKDTMIQASEKRELHYHQRLQKGDKVQVVLGWYLVNPKALKKLHLENEKVATEFIEFKKVDFSI